MIHYHNFSFDFRDPTLDFEGYTFAFRVFTPVNVYGLDPSRMAVNREPGRLTLRCDGLTWAGGQEQCEGGFEATLSREGGSLEWLTRAWHTDPIKSIGTLVRGLPRGQVAPCHRSFTDPGGDELLFTYPHMHRSYGESIPTPLLLVRSGEGDIRYVHCLDDVVRPKRLYLRPQAAGYYAEFLVEERASRWSTTFQAPPWRLGRCADPAEAFAAHQAHLERAFNLPRWERRGDVPAWANDLRLMLILHGAHWTGHIFNTFDRMLELLRWVAGQISPQSVLVYLPGWDGRYYWQYPQYEPDPRLGGSQALRRLISAAQALGFHLMPMFGLNAANRRQPEFERCRDALACWPDGDPVWGAFVDWDNDRTVEGWMAIMNVGAPIWRDWLLGRIARVVEEFGVQAVFLDISLMWVNDPRYDMYAGTVELIEALRRRYPGLLVVGEGWYDALLSSIPICQVTPPPLHPGLLTRYARAVGHLSHPAPGQGSTGVHEYGFRGFDASTLELHPHQIPTLAIAGDTVDKYGDQVKAIIARAQASRGEELR